VSAPRPQAGDAGPDLKVTPGPDLPARYAQASGDVNPIHLDDEVARAVGLPGVILHGLYTMAQVARAQEWLVAGDPRRLRSLSVRFRGIAVPGAEITVQSTVRSVSEGRVDVRASALQNGEAVIRNAEAVVDLDR
jgi:acyl dehydratase